MSTSYYKLDIETRKSIGKKSTKAIRRDGKIPSTLYFKGDEPESIAIDKIKLYQALKSDQRVYEVELGGESQYVMVKAVQYHPVTDEILHVDLYGVNMDKAVAIQVQLILEGNAKGVANEGGVLVQSLNEIEIECLPSDIPENLSVDISNLGLGDSFKVSDLQLDEKFVIKSDTEQVIASVTQAMKEEEAQPDLEEGETEGLADPVEQSSDEKPKDDDSSNDSDEG